ncbi:LacI family DNA-binding transcriptional regulator [Pelomonas sp. KK5]|uniref:LacI family DNA-binding transcriptional regulator n=1 Tax=Pelomonas sp. KK5 TaxID=1855730 RepID=UPI00097BF118|nr:LacI family DNA-binding transcriptional regulator [Pelomonas sp. KK5]
MATIKDVARLAGVGVGTASRAISGNGSVSADALARVNEAVAALNFKPSTTARALSTRSAGMIGIYVPDFAGDFYGPILHCVDRELRGASRHMVAANGCGPADISIDDMEAHRQQALDGIEFLIERQVDGLLVMGDALTDADCDGLWARMPRLVLLNQTSPSNLLHCFSSDHELAGRLAARALLSKGHREIACISGLQYAHDNASRMAGFHAELALHGVKIPKSRQMIGDFSFDGGHAAAKKLLKKGINFSAVFCANDMMAMALISCFGHAGVRVPEEVSVMGFDDSALARYTHPRLTTIRIPIQRTTISGCRFLLNQCYGLALPVEREFPPEVVWRESVVDGPYLTA